MEKKRLTFFGSVWRLFCPILIYEIARMLVMSGACVLVMLKDYQGYISMKDPVALTDALLEGVLPYSSEITMVSCLLALPVLIWLFFRDKKIESALGVRVIYRESPVYLYFLPFLLGAAAALILNHVLIYSRLMELLMSGYEEAAEYIYQGHFWSEVLSVAILVPCTEEFVFRGLIYRRMRLLSGPVAAMILSALTFGIYHGNLLQAIYAGILGLLFAYIYEKYQSIKAPILMHAGANLFSLLATETDILTRVYEDETLFLAVTVAAMIIFIGLFYLMLCQVEPIRQEE